MLKVVDRVCANKAELYWYFTNLDYLHKGTVSRLEWADALATVLKLDLPFAKLEEDLVKPEPDGAINYAKFLDRYRIEVCACARVCVCFRACACLVMGLIPSTKLPGVTADWRDAVVTRIYEKLFSICNNVTVSACARGASPRVPDTPYACAGSVQAVRR